MLATQIEPPFARALLGILLMGQHSILESNHLISKEDTCPYGVCRILFSMENELLTLTSQTPNKYLKRKMNSMALFR